MSTASVTVLKLHILVDGPRLSTHQALSRRRFPADADIVREVLMEVQATCKSIEAWISQPHGLVKSLPQIHEDILFDRAVTAQLHCPKKVQFTAYSTPALAAVGPDGVPVEGIELHPYKYLPTKKEILAYAVAIAEKIGADAPFDIATRDLLYVFPNGRARLGGMQAEPTEEFSSTVVYRHRQN